MTVSLPDTGPMPVITHTDLHPVWCDPRDCVTDTDHGEGMTLYLHKLTYLREPITGHSEVTHHGYDARIVIEVYRSDLRRDTDGSLIDDFGNETTKLDPPAVYVAGLDQIDLRDHVQARRVAEAMAQAAAVVRKFGPASAA